MTRPLIIIRTVDKRKSLTASPGQTAHSMTDGRGGWSEVTRIRRPAAVEWVGTAALKATVNLMFDAWASGGTVSAQIAALESLAPLSPTSEPDPVTVTGAWPISPTRRWQIQAATYGEPLKRSDGQVARVEVQVDLIEYRTPDVVVQTSPAKASQARHGTAGRASARTVTVRSGDTLSGIAAKYLGSASKWTTIASLNGLRDPNHLKVGAKLKLPS